MYVDAVGTLPPVGMNMLSVQMIPPGSGNAHLSFALSGASWRRLPTTRCKVSPRANGAV